MADTVITLKLPVHHVEAIIARLGEFPLKDVYEIVKSIEAQAGPQVVAANKLTPPSEGRLAGLDIK